MKTSLIALAAVPLLSLSSLSFAADAGDQAVTLSAAEMDSVTAGALALPLQLNISPVTIVQINVLSNGINLAQLMSGNTSGLFQIGLGFAR
ncbi:hypothetical protein E4K72_18925 [Oxalobacteraceae bacterium OM1]|nr:hypothetical protein E4K72_18925 [Oxalobacteraceae bacterium OM1]